MNASTSTRTAGSLTVITPSDREIAMTRILDAPRRLVFDAHTRPELVKRWLLGPDGWAMPVCEIDLRVGGAFRYVWRNADGREFCIGGVYREITAPARIVHMERFEESESQVTTLFDEQDGKTTLTMTLLFPSMEARDGALATGMAKGVTASYDRLEGVLASA